LSIPYWFSIISGTRALKEGTPSLIPHFFINICHREKIEVSYCGFLPPLSYSLLVQMSRTSMLLSDC
jgi:hypothetical protein